LEHPRPARTAAGAPAPGAQQAPLFNAEAERNTFPVTMGWQAARIPG